jgi:DNA-binding protein HU-beta
MNKGDLIEAVSIATGESKSAVAKSLDAIIRVIVDGVHRDKKVTIAGFGTFKQKVRKARVGINPVTKQQMEIRASTTIGFTPSESLRNGVEPAEATAAASHR